MIKDGKRDDGRGRRDEWEYLISNGECRRNGISYYAGKMPATQFINKGKDARAT